MLFAPFDPLPRYPSRGIRNPKTVCESASDVHVITQLYRVEETLDAGSAPSGTAFFK